MCPWVLQVLVPLHLRLSTSDQKIIRAAGKEVRPQVTAAAQQILQVRKEAQAKEKMKIRKQRRPRKRPRKGVLTYTVIGTVYPNIPLSSASIHGHPRSSLGATLGVRMSATAYGNHSTVSSVWPIGASRLNLRPRAPSI